MYDAPKVYTWILRVFTALFLFVADTKEHEVVEVQWHGEGGLSSIVYTKFQVWMINLCGGGGG